MFQWSDDVAHGTTLRSYNRFHLIRQQPLVHEGFVPNGRHGRHDWRLAAFLSSDALASSRQRWVCPADRHRHLLRKAWPGEEWSGRAHPELLHRNHEDLHHQPTWRRHEVQRAVRQDAVHPYRTANARQQEFRNVLFTKIKESKTAALLGRSLGCFGSADHANGHDQHREHSPREVESSVNLLKTLLSFLRNFQLRLQEESLFLSIVKSFLMYPVLTFLPDHTTRRAAKRA